MSLAATGPGMSSGPPRAGLILHREGQASRKEDVSWPAPDDSDSGQQLCEERAVKPK